MPGRYLNIACSHYDNSTTQTNNLNQVNDGYPYTTQTNDSFDDTNFLSPDSSHVTSLSPFTAPPSIDFNLDFDYDYSSIDPSMAMSYSHVPSNFSSTPSSYFPDFPFAPDSAESAETPPSELDSQIESPEFKESPLEAALIETPPKRKRGRPRQDPTARLEKTISRRIPHNKVERKYRNGLNDQLEHLRLNLPTLPIFDPISLLGPPKPGKLAILAAAVDYIKSLEAETEKLADELDELRSLQRGASKPPLRRTGSKRQIRQRRTKSS